MKTFILTLSLLSGALMASAQQTVKKLKLTSPVILNDGSVVKEVNTKSKLDTIVYTPAPFKIPANMSVSELQDWLAANKNLVAGNNIPTVRLPNNDVNMPVVKTDRTQYNMPVVGMTDSTAIKQKYKEMLLGPKKP